MRRFKDVETLSKNNNRKLRDIIIIILIISIIGGFSIGVGYRLADRLITSGNDENNLQNYKVNQFSIEKNNISEVVETLETSVVAITNRVLYRDWFNNIKIGDSSGSGVVYSENSDLFFIVTNNHVIENSDELLIEINDEMIEAIIIGTDAYADLAVLKVNKDDVKTQMTPITIGNSNEIRPGDTAIAIGNPLGYNHTITVGVISALNRDLMIGSDIPLLQTDAAINPGNSGGALINGNGELIGINTAKIADTKVEGIGFAIPINSAKPIIDSIINKGFVDRPYLGIYGRTVDEDLSDLYEIPLGVMITEVVPNSGADDADLASGDVIIAIDGKKINSIEQLSSEIEQYDVGDLIEVKIVRNNEEQLIKDVKLKNKSN